MLLHAHNAREKNTRNKVLIGWKEKCLEVWKQKTISKTYTKLMTTLNLNIFHRKLSVEAIPVCCQDENRLIGA